MATTAKRTTTTASVKDSTVEKTGDSFASLRDRARRNRRGRERQMKDFVLGKNEGFDPEIRVEFPLPIAKERNLYYALKEGDVFEQVRVMLGPYEFERLIDVISQYDDSSELFAGFADMLLEHWAGKGASEVPGGSGES